VTAGGGTDLRRVADRAALARAAAEEVARAAGEAVPDRGAFTIALAGASTPRPLYALLADPAEPFRTRIPWDRTHAFFGDERHVPPDHPESNFRQAHETLLSRVPIASVHRMRGELPEAAEAADSYQADLSAFFAVHPDAPPPRLDLVLLGIGTDGHTASLFPGSPALEERRRWVAAPYVVKLRSHRITLTLPVLCRARMLLLLVSGAEKADALARVIAPPPGAELLPAARVAREAEGAVVWITDAAAAARVSASRT
jgi:6-phosphogluconolactonase